jgi:hypothetical protein
MLYIILDVSLSFAAETESIAVQTTWATAQMMTFIVLILHIPSRKAVGIRALKWGAVGYLVAGIMYYGLNAVIYDNFTDWMLGFNNLPFMRALVTVVFILCGVVVGWKTR